MPTERKKNTEKNFENFVTIVIPLALPGMGKTTLHEEVFLKHFRTQKDVKYTMISNDQIRKELIDGH